MSFIITSDLHKIYNEKKENKVEALNSLNISIDKGDFISIEGTSGSGKSTLLHILAGLDRATSGVVEVGGRDITKLKAAELAAYRNTTVGIVLQDFFLIEYRTVTDNVIVPLLFSKNRISHLYEKANRILKKLNIHELAYRKVNELSGGQKQRVAIARAMVNDPDILLADEPTGALDSKTTHDIMNVFTELNKAGKTVIIVTHDPIVSGYSKKIVKIEDGVIA